MGLLNPAALYLLALAPVLIVAYLARERTRRVTVSSVLALRALHALRGEQFGGRPRFRWPFFVELLVLMLAALALAGPYLLQRGNPVAIVVDNSAAMQAHLRDGRTRYQAALAALAQTLKSDAGATSVALYVISPHPHQVGAAYGNAEASISAMGRIRTTDAPADLSATAALVRQLLADRRLGRVIVASSHRVESAPAARLVSLNINEPEANYAIGGFSLAGNGLGSSTVRARVTLANFSAAAQSLQLQIRADGKLAETTSAAVAAGATTTVDALNLPVAQVYEARLSPSDGFILDNTAYAVLTAPRQLTILFVSPTAADGANLRSIPGVVVVTRGVNSYTPQDLAAADLVIFEYAVPKELPPLSTLLVMPPPGDPVFGFTIAPTAHIDLTGWSATDALTDGVNFRLLNVHSGEYLGEHPWMPAIVEGARGGLIVSGQRDGHRYVATGFNPFPYLGRANLPMSILTLNLFSYLTGVGAPSQSYRTGETWRIPAGVTEVVTPAGQRVEVQPGSVFARADAQGVYQLRGKTTMLRAVNLNDLTVSDLESDQPLRLLNAAAPNAAAALATVTTNLTPLVLALVIGLVLLEAFLVYRARRGPLEV